MNRRPHASEGLTACALVLIQHQVQVAFVRSLHLVMALNLIQTAQTIVSADLLAIQPAYYLHVHAYYCALLHLGDTIALAVPTCGQLLPILPFPLPFALVSDVFVRPDLPQLLVVWLPPRHTHQAGVAQREGRAVPFGLQVAGQVIQYFRAQALVASPGEVREPACSAAAVVAAPVAELRAECGLALLLETFVSFDVR